MKRSPKRDRQYKVRRDGSLSLPKVRIVSRGDKTASDILDVLRSDFIIRRERYLNLGHSSIHNNDVVLFDLGECEEAKIKAVQVWLARSASFRNIVVFITSDEGRRILLQNGMLAGSNCVRRPLTPENLASLVQSLWINRAVETERRHAEYHNRLELQFPDQAPAIAVGEGILDEIMVPFDKDQVYDVQSITERTGMLVDTLYETGIDRWMAGVRMHHNATYQHCLLVTGTIIAFGRLLKMYSADMKRLAVGGLMHDLGKSEIPLSILDKTSSLSKEELEIIRKHPAEGIRRASGLKGVSSDLLRMIGDHHEYLDGSGHPNNLMAENINDPVRLLTIADIFAALIEKRSYRAQMSAHDALDVIRSMEGKIDMAFLRAVQPVMLQVRP